jgi:hypothetical protein
MGNIAILEILHDLMHCESMDDVYEVVVALHEVEGLPQPEGDFEQGWSWADLENAGGE